MILFFVLYKSISSPFSFIFNHSGEEKEIVKKKIITVCINQNHSLLYFKTFINGNTMPSVFMIFLLRAFKVLLSLIMTISNHRGTVCSFQNNNDNEIMTEMISFCLIK